MIKSFIKKYVLIRIIFISLSLIISVLKADIPPPWYNKVAYYVFDSGGPDHYPLTSFTDEANIVVIFEGTLWELADTAHYYTGWMTTTNVNYHYYSEIIRDIRILQSRGIKVLMNVDDAKSWSTPTPFTTYEGKQYNIQQFAEFVKACAIDSLHLDGISLDIEHGAIGNDYYVSLIKELGKYFGPLSSNYDSQMYIAAIYAGGRPGYVIGTSPEVAKYFNFIMDMAYFDRNYVRRFNQWAEYIGPSKVMIGVLNDYFDLKYATDVARWQPPSGYKAGIMVYAANNLKAYTDSVFRALSVPVAKQVVLMQNYPNPFNTKTVIKINLLKDGFIKLKIYNLLGQEIKTLISEDMKKGYHYFIFDGTGLANGLYFAKLIVNFRDGGIAKKTIKMLLVK